MLNVKVKPLILVGIMITLGMQAFVVVAEEDCTPISNLIDPSNLERLKGTPIRASGHYCLIGNATAYRPDGADRVGVLTVERSDVEIDLRGYQVYGKSSGQVVFTSEHLLLPATMEKGASRSKEINRHIIVRNGILRSRDASGMLLNDSVNIGFASDLMGFVDRKEREQNKTYLEIANQDLAKFNQELVKIRDNFPLTEHTIENIKVSAEDIGVGISGGGNIIRNSVIKIGENDINWGKTTPQELRERHNRQYWGGGTASLYLFGPNQLIENNIIIFKGKTRTSRSSAAPIKIHAADGTIIRNNTIIIESSGEDIPQTAISIFDSKNVVIENNKIFGTKSVYKIWDDEDKGSSVIESGTTFPSFWKKPRPSF